MMSMCRRSSPCGSSGDWARADARKRILGGVFLTRDISGNDKPAARSPDGMPQAYFESRFHCEGDISSAPAEFGIITAYATTGEKWTIAQNQAADAELEAELREQGRWMMRITGYSPFTGHAEPGWGVELDFDDLCDIGARFEQDAIYYISGDRLYVSYCDDRRERAEVGPFRERTTRSEP
jgi:hypothetical protein